MDIQKKPFPLLLSHILLNPETGNVIKSLISNFLKICDFSNILHSDLFKLELVIGSAKINIQYKIRHAE